MTEQTPTLRETITSSIDQVRSAAPEQSTPNNDQAADNHLDVTTKQTSDEPRGDVKPSNVEFKQQDQAANRDTLDDSSAANEPDTSSPDPQDQIVFVPRTGQDAFACDTLNTFTKSKPNFKIVQRFMHGFLAALARQHPDKYRTNIGLWLDDAYDMALSAHNYRNNIKQPTPKPARSATKLKHRIKPPRVQDNSIRGSIKAAIAQHRRA